MRKQGRIAHILIVFLLLQQVGVVWAASGIKLSAHNANELLLTSLQPVHEHTDALAHSNTPTNDHADDHCQDSQCCGVVGCHSVVQLLSDWGTVESPAIVTVEYQRSYFSLFTDSLFRPPIIG